ncbi:hypothetical protein PIB30_063513, partial [Stylosanthes scabra]|nr:hypothetical protein [Stylosanthes scabra]
DDKLLQDIFVRGVMTNEYALNLRIMKPHYHALMTETYMINNAIATAISLVHAIPMVRCWRGGISPGGVADRTVC